MNWLDVDGVVSLVDGCGAGGVVCFLTDLGRTGERSVFTMLLRILKFVFDLVVSKFIRGHQCGNT